MLVTTTARTSQTEATALEYQLILNVALTPPDLDPTARWTAVGHAALVTHDTRRTFQT